jgi:nucleotide-binding universal stress UspA family protein
MFKRLLVPLDGSELAERAISVAARIARASGGTIVFVHVVLPPVEFGTYTPERRVALKPGAFEARLAEAEKYLRDITIIYAPVLAGIETETNIATGAAAPEIFSTAQLEKVDLIVMCSHGETGLKRWVFGSVAQEAVRHSPAPVLVLNGHGTLLRVPDAAHPLRILVALDGSALSENALEPAIQLLTTLTNALAEVGGELYLLHVVDVPPAYGKFWGQAYFPGSLRDEVSQQAETYVKAVTDRLLARPRAESQLTVTSGVYFGSDIAGTIIKLAEHAEHTDGYDLIAMATHGRSGLRRLIMGSVTEHVLGATRLPLLMVRPPRLEAKQVQAAEDSRTEKGTEAEV